MTNTGWTYSHDIPEPMLTRLQPKKVIHFHFVTSTYVSQGFSDTFLFPNLISKRPILYELECTVRRYQGLFCHWRNTATPAQTYEHFTVPNRFLLLYPSIIYLLWCRYMLFKYFVGILVVLYCQGLVWRAKLFEILALRVCQMYSQVNWVLERLSFSIAATALRCLEKTTVWRYCEG